MKSRLNLSTILFFAFALATTACGKVSGSIGGHHNKGPVFSLKEGTGAEIVSSSNQDTVTTGGYKVQSSAGNTLDKLEATTAGGYKVQITVQGVILQ